MGNTLDDLFPLTITGGRISSRVNLSRTKRPVSNAHSNHTPRSLPSGKGYLATPIFHPDLMLLQMENMTPHEFKLRLKPLLESIVERAISGDNDGAMYTIENLLAVYKRRFPDDKRFDLIADHLLEIINRHTGQIDLYTAA